MDRDWTKSGHGQTLDKLWIFAGNCQSSMACRNWKLDQDWTKSGHRQTLNKLWIFSINCRSLMAWRNLMLDQNLTSTWCSLILNEQQHSMTNWPPDHTQSRPSSFPKQSQFRPSSTTQIRPSSHPQQSQFMPMVGPIHAQSRPRLHPLHTQSMTSSRPDQAQRRHMPSSRPQWAQLMPRVGNNLTWILERVTAGPWVGLEWAMGRTWALLMEAKCCPEFVCLCPMLVKSLPNRLTVGYWWVIATINGIQSLSRVCSHLVFVQSLSIGQWASHGRTDVFGKSPHFVQSLSMSRVCPVSVQYPILEYQKLKMWTLNTFSQVQGMSRYCPMLKSA